MRAGLLRRLARRVGGVRAGSDGFIYEVDQAGQRLCAYWRGEGLARTRGAHEPGVQFVEHRLAISEVHVRLAEAARGGSFELVDWQSEPAAWRPFLGAMAARQVLKPDAYVVLARGDAELIWFVEVDRGTVSAAALRRQLTTYVAFWRSGHPGEEVMPRVLWLVPDATRAERLAQLASETAAPNRLVRDHHRRTAAERAARRRHDSGRSLMTGVVPQRTARPPLYGDRERWGLVRADSLSFLALLPDASIDAVVTDPPYGLDFGGHGWDGRDLKFSARCERGRGPSTGEALEAFTAAWAEQVRRVLRPGGYLVAFGAPRTVHRLVAGMERADLEIRDQLLWLFGSGMPKSPRLPGGLGTTLKPAYEPIVLARRRLDRGMRTVAGNVFAHGTGALNVDAATVYEQRFRGSRAEPLGRWPAHVTLGHDDGCTAGYCDADCAVAELDRHAPAARPSRFFYCAKASRAEREAGLEALTRAQCTGLLQQRAWRASQHPPDRQAAGPDALAGAVGHADRRHGARSLHRLGQHRRRRIAGAPSVRRRRARRRLHRRGSSTDRPLGDAGRHRCEPARDEGPDGPAAGARSFSSLRPPPTPSNPRRWSSR